MNNVTTEISTTMGFFHRHLLGESLSSSLVRLALILSAITTVWSGIMLALIIHTKCQRARQMRKTSNPHHLYDSNSSLNRKRSNYHTRNRRFNSSASSLSSSRCYSIRQIVSRLNQCCVFWSSSRTRNENFVKQKQQRATMPRNSCTTSSKIQIVVENMTRRPFSPNDNIGRKISFYHETDSSSADELKNLYPIEDDQISQIEINRKTSNIVQLMEPSGYIHYPSISFPISENEDDYQATSRLQKLHEFNTKATLFFHPITRRLSNANTNSCLPPINTIQKQQRKSLLVVSSARELASDNGWQFNHSLLNDQIAPDESTASSPRQLPLVMITDTSSSNTNIVELETFEDNHRLMSDIEKRLARELRASYRPRHST